MVSLDEINREYQRLTCPICKQLLKEASFLRCGHEFCESCISRWLLSSNANGCPICRRSAYPSDIKPCILIRSIITKIESDQRNQFNFQSATPLAREIDTAIRIHIIVQNLRDGIKKAIIDVMRPDGNSG
jgi:hypothetical protein